MDAKIPSWVSNIVYGQDRSVSEWIQILDSYAQHATYFPFIQDHITTLCKLVKNEIQLRSRIQKFVRNIKARICQRRLIGDVDLYTMAPIPRHSQIRVCDYASKSVYVFHTQTAIRILDSALKQSIYGIPTPQMPRNPYTNISFTLAQLASIMSQIGMQTARICRFPPSRLLDFRNCMFDIQDFKHAHRHILNMDAARTFLLSFDDPVSLEFYMEVLDDTVTNEILVFPKWNMIRGHIRARSMPAELLKRFDTLVLSLFLFQNHSVCYTFRSYTAMLDELDIVYRDAVLWWRRLPRRILPRGGLGAVAFAVGSQNRNPP
jgi:hypothetical protein